MNRKELNMSKNINNNQTVDEKKGKRMHGTRKQATAHTN